MGNLVQYIYMTPVFVDVRFGRWEALLNMKQPEASQVYANIIYRFGRGMAMAQQAKIREAKHELDILRSLLADSSLSVPLYPFSAPIEGAHVAEYLLEGSIALSDKKFDEAIPLLAKAVKTEESMVYNEPRDWILNPKHYLGNAFLKSGQWENARKTFQEDLKNNRDNGWALFGLYQALMSGNKRAEADKVLAKAKKAFTNADIELHGPVF
jgi:tetratricopeptide (TPR) repeat protein